MYKLLLANIKTTNSNTNGHHIYIGQFTKTESILM